MQVIDHIPQVSALALNLALNGHTEHLFQHRYEEDQRDGILKMAPD